MAEFRFLFTASDYERTVDFYARVLGLSIVASWVEGGRGTIVAATAEGEIEIIENLATVLSERVTGGALAWEVDDLDTYVERIRSLGAPVLVEPADRAWGHRNATIVDPDGLQITLFQVL